MNQNKSVASQPVSNLSTPAPNASGPLRFNMMNDYMFRAVLQENNKVLRGLICSLLHLSEDEIISARITNPIILGESITNKEFRLDINVCLDDNSLINLEMQIDDRMDWQNRSLIYLCRSFDQLDRGQEYIEAQPVIHIGFLNYTLFKESPEFYATYKLINVKNHDIYNDNFTLSVVNLSRIDLATEEDIRKRCLDREEYYREIRTYKKIIAEDKACIAEKDACIKEKDAMIQKLSAELERLKADIGK